MSDAADITEDGFLGGRLRLRQPRRGHRAGHDAMLLAAATAIGPGGRLIDFGAGVGAAGLAVATRVTGLDLTLVDIDPALVMLAQQNIALNTLSARAVALDLAASLEVFAEADLLPDSVDGILMNPPFNRATRHQPSPDSGRKLAHEARAATLDIWVHAARRLLRTGGVLTLIWRAEGLAEVLRALDRGFGGVAVLPVHPASGAVAIRVLVKAVKGSRAPMTLLPGLVLNDDAGKPTAETDAVLRGSELLPLADV